MARLELQQIRAGYGGVEVLHGVDLVVPESSTVALLGPNGAGKTTLLKVAGGLVRPTSGTVLLDGQAIERTRPSRRARHGVCLIPEGRAVFKDITVRENIAMHVNGRGVDRAVDEAASHFPILGDRLDQLAGTLSGGEQQMLAVARALVTDPAIVLADELSVGLAPVVVNEIFDVAIAALRAKGCSLVVVEQYVERALDVADYVYVLSKGNVVLVGEPALVRDSDVARHYLGAEVGVGVGQGASA